MIFNATEKTKPLIIKKFCRAKLDFIKSIKEKIEQQSREINTRIFTMN